MGRTLGAGVTAPRALGFDPAPLEGSAKDWARWWACILRNPDLILNFSYTKHQKHLLVQLSIYDGTVLTLEYLDLSAPSTTTALSVLFIHEMIPPILQNQSLGCGGGKCLPLMIDGEVIFCDHQYYPAYPLGNTIVVRRSHIAVRPTFLSLDIPAEVSKHIISLLLKKKIFIAAGSFGSGTEFLLAACAVHIQTTHPNLHTVRVQTPGHRIECFAERVINAWNYDGHEMNVVMGAALEDNPDLLMIDRLGSDEMMQGMLERQASGAYVLASVISSAKVFGRLDDFATREVWEPALGGYVVCYHLHKLCNHCKVEDNDIQGQWVRGQGCIQCNGFGVNGKQMVVDVWDVDNGSIQQLTCAMEQAMKLISQGVLSKDDMRRTNIDTISHHVCQTPMCRVVATMKP